MEAIEKGYVFITSEGKYVRRFLRITHTGQKTVYEKVGNICNATIFMVQIESSQIEKEIGFCVPAAAYSVRKVFLGEYKKPIEKE